MPSGTPGDLRTQIAVDRSVPYQLCNFAGGRNPQHGSVVDLQWKGSFEGDVVSYSVWREKQAAEATDKLVCDSVRATECTDRPRRAGAPTITYYVRPAQDNFSLDRSSARRRTWTLPAVGTDNIAPTRSRIGRARARHVAVDLVDARGRQPDGHDHLLPHLSRRPGDRRPL